SAATAATASSAPKRADWMLVPPGADDWTARVDPTKLKTRKFASGKGAKAPGEKSGISAIWTETPEEKRQRLEDEVLGRKEVATNSGKNETRGARGAGGEDEAEQAAIAKRIREYNERMRGKSMVEEHTGRQAGKEEEDDPIAPPPVFTPPRILTTYSRRHLLHPPPLPAASARRFLFSPKYYPATSQLRNQIP
ncbi:hypothetical protein V501_09762, partial [Pseudogymnoascus sp. VKM F-4519 (FW-2642)]